MPPNSFHHTVSLLGTYAMAIKALLTESCDYFIQVMHLRRTLKGMENKEDVLSAETYRVLIWNVAKDGCQFFSTTVTEDDYTPRGLPDEIAPRSDLRPTITNLRRTLPIKPATFPREWEESWGSSRQRQGVNYGRDGAGGRGGGANRLGQGRGQYGNGTDPRGWFVESTHPRIKALMMPYAEANDRLILSKICPRNARLPMCRDRSSQKMICNFNSLGRCNRIGGCEFAHLLGPSLPRDYVDEVCRIITAGSGSWRPQSERGFGRGGNRGANQGRF